MKLLQLAHRSRFIRHNAIFFVGSAAVGALNYLYYPVMGRLLTPTSFGEVQTLISLFLQITIFLSVLGLVTINVVTNYRDQERRNAVVLEFEKLALAIGLVLFAATLVFHEQLQHFLQFGSAIPFILLMVALVITVPLTFRGSFLRGKQRFGQASFVNVIAAGGKLLLAIVFVRIGYSTSGAIGGLIGAQLIACFLAIGWARKSGLHRPETISRWQLPSLRVIAPELRYGAVVLVTSLAITLQYSIDVIVVKHYFDPHTAGLYAAVAGVARIIFFLTASIALVLMPLARVGAAPADNRRLLGKSLLLLLAVGVPVVVLFAIAPEPIMHLLMGKQYVGVASLLPALGLAIFIISIVNLIASYYLALRRSAIAGVVALGAIATDVLIVANHASLRAVVMSLLLGSMAMLAAVGIWMARPQGREA